MSVPQIVQGTFTLRREWAATPARVFAAWADGDLKKRWFFGPPGKWLETRRELDFRVGGREIVEGRFDEPAITTRFDARYHLIEPGHRLIFVYDLHVADQFHSVTLASLHLEPAGTRTRVTYTEQIAFLDGEDGTEMRRTGTEPHFVRISRLVEGA